MKVSHDTPSIQQLPSRCDESGLCEEIDAAEFSGDVERCIASTPGAVALVDLSPVILGHCLVSPREHVTSTLLISRRRRQEVWYLAKELARKIADLTAKQTVLLEHGLTSSFEGPSCVRHAHVHVAPMDLPGGFLIALPRHLSNVVFVDSREEAEARALKYPSYVLGGTHNEWFVGNPDKGTRQVTRVLLSAACASPPLDVDWVFGAEGPRFIASLNLLGKQPAWPSNSEYLLASSGEEACSAQKGCDA